MQFLTIVRRRVERFAAEAFDQLLDAEADGVRRLYAEGIVRAAWSREDIPGACMLVEAASIEAVEAAMATLPLAQHGMLEMQIIPLRGYRGFGPRAAI